MVVLGSTGSIGTQALDVAARNPDRFAVVGVAATGRDPDALVAQACAFPVEVVAVSDPAAAPALAARLAAQGSGAVVVDDAALAARWPADVVVNGLAGAAGLVPTLAALESGALLALANKESLIIGGPLVKAAAAPDQIVPVDSEHSALAQALRSGAATEVRRLVLTASGGPFRGWDRAALATVTVEQALAHPTWSMGPLVTINSATLMNKGLEVIEAHLLFDIPLERIDVVVHPQSVVHSMVEFVDGSTIAQASPPDMRLPIALGMAWPDRVPEAAPACDWTRAATWEFFPLDEDAFPAIRWARVAGAAGGTAPAVLNGADESAVAAFLDGRLPFDRIVTVVGRVLDEHLTGTDAEVRWVEGNNAGLPDVLGADRWARSRADLLIREGI